MNQRAGSTALHRGATLAAALLCAWTLAGCGNSTPLAPDGLRNPSAIAIACVEKTGQAKTLAACSSDGRVRAFVPGGAVGSVSIAEFVKNTWFDTDPSVPGFTPLMIGDLPAEIVADPVNPKFLYMSLAFAPALVRMDVTDLTAQALRRLPLPFVPAGLTATATPKGRLYLADTAGGAVWRLDLATAADGEPPTKIVIGGSPRALVAVPSTGRLYVAHRDHGHVTVIDLNTDAVVARISLGPACNDGIDNDGDGKTDAADSGCDGSDDRFEGDPEVGARCNDGIDNDGDGQTDAVDLGCAVSALVDACRDGIDNDGDGKTDFPADPGCVSFAGGSERWDAPSCADGVDNDGDGQTDVADSDCADATADTELKAVVAGVQTACNDGVDNDGDGKTDTDDGDCPTASGDGEQHPACADGIDNDGDGKTDLEDEACVHRGSASEVAADAAPMSDIAATFGGRWVVVTHRRQRAALIIDTKTNTLVLPSTGARYRHPSTLDARDGINGVSLAGQPLALAPVTLKGRDAMAVTLQLGGLLVLTFEDLRPVEPEVLDASDNPVQQVQQWIGLEPANLQGPSEMAAPALTVAGVRLDLGTKPPRRHASFGSLAKVQTDGGQTIYFGLRLSDAPSEHRSELWTIEAEAVIPGSERQTGRLARSDLLVDPSADFCRMGVVPGDRLVLNRGVAAAACGDLQGAAVSYEVVEVTPTGLRLANKTGVVDEALTLDTQLAPPAPISVSLPTAACFSRRAIHYQIRAQGWLVRGSRTGLLSSRGRLGQACAPWQANEPAQASRIPFTSLKPGADATQLSCPLALADAVQLEAVPYGGTTPAALAPFENLIWSGTLLPGCATSDQPGDPLTLLRPVRGTTWNYSVRRGLAPARAAVGTNPVALISGAGRSHVWAVDQGNGILYSVPLPAGLTGTIQTLN